MATKAGVRQCPYCKEEIKADAVRCKHCRSAVLPEKPPHGGVCPYCKESIHPEAVKCKHCGSMVGPQAAGCDCAETKGAAQPASAFMAGAGPTRGLTSGLPVGPGASGPGTVMALKTSCGTCEYGGMIDPFAGVSYGQQVCCIEIPVVINGRTYINKICYTQVCGTQSFPVYGGPIIWA